MNKRTLKLFLFIFAFFTLTYVGSFNCKAADTTSNDIDRSFANTDTIKIKNSQIFSKINGYVYIKYKPASDGYVKLTFNKITDSSPDFNGYVWICNSKKKPLSAGEYFTSKPSTTDYTRVFYGVRKGVTYYFKVKDEKQGCKITYSQKPVTETSGSSADKSVEMVTKKFSTGYIVAGENAYDYYKIVLKKDMQIDFLFHANTNECITIEINRAGYYTSKFYANFTMNGKTQTAVSKKLKAGTYYVKVCGKNSTSSGYYKIQWRPHTV